MGADDMAAMPFERNAEGHIDHDTLALLGDVDVSSVDEVRIFANELVADDPALDDRWSLPALIIAASHLQECAVCSARRAQTLDTLSSELRKIHLPESGFISEAQKRIDVAMGVALATYDLEHKPEAEARIRRSFFGFAKNRNGIRGHASFGAGRFGARPGSGGIRSAGVGSLVPQPWILAGVAGGVVLLGFIANHQFGGSSIGKSAFSPTSTSEQRQVSSRAEETIAETIDLATTPPDGNASSSEKAGVPDAADIAAAAETTAATSAADSTSMADTAVSADTVPQADTAVVSDVPTVPKPQETPESKPKGTHRVTTTPSSPTLSVSTRPIDVVQTPSPRPKSARKRSLPASLPTVFLSTEQPVATNQAPGTASPAAAAATPVPVPQVASPVGGTAAGSATSGNTTVAASISSEATILVGDLDSLDTLLAAFEATYSRRSVNPTASVAAPSAAATTSFVCSVTPGERVVAIGTGSVAGRSVVLYRLVVMVDNAARDVVDVRATDGCASLLRRDVSR